MYTFTVFIHNVKPVCTQWSRFDKMSSYYCFINGFFRPTETRTSRKNRTCKKLTGGNGNERNYDVRLVGQSMRQVWPGGRREEGKNSWWKLMSLQFFSKKVHITGLSAPVDPPAMVSC